VLPERPRDEQEKKAMLANGKARVDLERRFWDDQYRRWETAEADLAGECLVTSSGYMNHLLSRVRPGDVLSIGGGIDAVAVGLAAEGARVVSVDISEVACRRTAQLAAGRPLCGSLEIVNRPFEELDYTSAFDLVISSSALHHMDFAAALSRVHAAVRPGGVLIAQEPTCLSTWLSALQKLFPYHPQEDHSPTEITLGRAELALLHDLFSPVEITFFQFIARPWLAYLLESRGLDGLVDRLRRIDARLIRSLLPLRAVCQYAVIRAWK
jgi:SAM-dependent methyltransferase